MLRQRLLRPLAAVQIRRSLDQASDIPLDGIALHILQLLVLAVRRHVDARPASEQRQRAFVVAVPRELPVLGVRFFLRTAEDRAELREDFETGRVAALGCHLRADLGDRAFDAGGAVRRYEYRFGVFGGEGPAGGAGAGLHYHWRPLWRGLADVRSGDGEVLSFVVDFADEGWVGVDSGLAVELHCVGAPGGIPEFVDDRHILFADGIALVVLGLVLAVGEVAGGGVEVTGHDVPADSSSSEMVNCTQSTGEVIGLFVGGRYGAAEANALCCCGHGGHER